MSANAAFAIIMSSAFLMLAAIGVAINMGPRPPEDPIAARLETIRNTYSLGEEAKERLMMEALRGITNLPTATVEQ